MEPAVEVGAQVPVDQEELDGVPRSFGDLSLLREDRQFVLALSLALLALLTCLDSLRDERPDPAAEGEQEEEDDEVVLADEGQDVMQHCYRPRVWGCRSIVRESKGQFGFIIFYVENVNPPSSKMRLLSLNESGPMRGSLLRRQGGDLRQDLCKAFVQGEPHLPLVGP